MKLLIASDIHGSAYWCRALMAQVEAESPDTIVLLGDLLYHGPRNDLPRDYAPKEVLAMLNTLADRVVAVRGNCDSEVDQMVLDFFPAWPIMRRDGRSTCGGLRWAAASKAERRACCSARMATCSGRRMCRRSRAAPLFVRAYPREGDCLS